eukprot:1938515-Pyramimonas_sp.AAC.1
MGIFSLPFCDWCSLRVYSLFPSVIGARYGYILSPLLRFVTYRDAVFRRQPREHEVGARCAKVAHSHGADAEGKACLVAQQVHAKAAVLHIVQHARLQVAMEGVNGGRQWRAAGVNGGCRWRVSMEGVNGGLQVAMEGVNGGCQWRVSMEGVNG